MRDKRETLGTTCQVVGVAGAGLMLPCYLADLAYNTNLLHVLGQVMLVAFACAAIATVWIDYHR